MAKELKRLIENGSLERATEISEDCFVSPAVNSIRFTKIERSNKKTKSTNSEHGRTSFKNFKKYIKGEDGDILPTKLVLDYAYGQIKLDEKRRNLCKFTVTGGKRTVYYRFLKGI